MGATYFLLRGIEPPDLRLYPDSTKTLYWSWVTEFGLKAKDSELARGLNKHGKPLPGVKEKTRKNRRSAMTATGRGDPSAPYLMPGRGLSRTRSLLAGRAHRNYAEFYWRYDPWTGDQWGKVLSYHAARSTDGRYDVVGLSADSTRKVQAAALLKWEAWKRSQTVTIVDVERRQVASMGPAMRPGVRQPVAQPSPWRTRDEWERFVREPVPKPRMRQPRFTAPSVRGGAINRLLSWSWGT